VLTWLRAVEVSGREALRWATATATATAVSVWLLSRSTVVTLRWLGHRCLKHCFVVPSRFDEFLVQLLKVICPISVSKTPTHTHTHIPHVRTFLLRILSN
jgi:hypothetical protein